DGLGQVLGVDLAAQGEALGPDGGIAGLPSHRSGCSLWWQAAAPIVSPGAPPPAASTIYWTRWWLRPSAAASSRSDRSVRMSVAMYERRPLSPAVHDRHRCRLRHPIGIRGPRGGDLTRG